MFVVALVRVPPGADKSRTRVPAVCTAGAGNLGDWGKDTEKEVATAIGNSV